MSKIIVLTPVKNEDWILECFLRITSTFADHILIADQNSTDRSHDIYKKFSKVTLIQNESITYNESDRQILLINTARELFGNNNILLALDADEIIAFNKQSEQCFNLIRQQKAGTVIFIEKPDLFKSPWNCIRYSDNYFPIGFVDDGTIIQPKKIHSVRIPMPSNFQSYKEYNLKLLHFGLVNTHRQKAKVRYYSAVEAVLRTKGVLVRRENYNPATDISKRETTITITKTPERWLSHFTEIELQKLSSSYFYMWYYKEILSYFEKYGSRKFWGDNIWDVNWDNEKGRYGFENLKIMPPPFWAVRVFDSLLLLKNLTKKLIRGNNG